MSSIPFGSSKGLTLDDEPFPVYRQPRRTAKGKRVADLHMVFSIDKDTYIYCGSESDECICNSDYACRCDRYVAYPSGRVVEYYWAGDRRRRRTVR